jgi:hypothetical protein
MPYGIPKDIGGDSEENEKWMKKCISSVMEGGKSKDSAVLICKKQLIKTRRSNSSSKMEK